jgi:beta-mannosidase
VNGVADEVRQQCLRWQGRPSLAVLCGNSEVEQQAAMSGATRDRWAPALFHETLAHVCEQGLPAVPYWPSSAHGGAFPHQGDVGTTSYYGVGAYMRPLEDARRAGVRFATECLAFANVPEPGNLDRMHGGSLRVHHATWKARVPRDLGAGWDFDDVRDHYVASLFALDPARLRYADHERYLALARVAVGEVMAATFAEWRRPGSTCKGALVWFWRDLWAGAGWGLLDSEGLPKSAYYYLKRVLQPVSLSFSDEGGNGLYVHVGNEHPRALQAEIEVTAWRHGRTQVGQTRQTIEVPAHSARSWPLLGWFDWFADWSWVYRFGPASAQVLSAELRSDTGAVLARAFFFPTGMALPVEHDLGLKAHARPVEPGLWTLEIETDRFAQAVYLDADGVVADDLHFHLAPGQRQATLLRATPGSKASVGLSGWVRALNSDASVAIEVLADEPEHQP